MIGNIAHQWRQPLSVLSLVIQNLRYDFKEGRLTENELEEHVAKALRAIEQMTSTIDDYRDFFKPSRLPENFSVMKAIEDCIELVDATLKAHNIFLAASGPRELGLFGYPSEFSQIILNLISNAKDALQERKIAQGRIEIAVTAHGDGATIAVRDNAGGIAPEHIEKVFDPYFTTKEKGTGIGLYMTRAIVEQHMHGSIRAENSGEGALFTLSLPRNLTASDAT
jgi:signal transduction histidine kinase